MHLITETPSADSVQLLDTLLQEIRKGQHLPETINHLGLHVEAPITTLTLVVKLEIPEMTILQYLII